MFALPVFIIVLANCKCCWSACTYPSDLIGEWYSTSFGTLNFVTDQSFSSSISALSITPLTFTCHESSGNQYVSVTSYSLFTGVIVDVYLCMNVQKISAIKYYFTLDSNLDAGTGIRFYSPTSTGLTVTLSEACSRSDTRSPGEFELLLKKDQISNAVTTCPINLQSTFNVTMTTQTADECVGTQLEGSTGALLFSYSSCVTGTFNTGGYLQCLYSREDTYNYVILYNNDSTTDESSTYIFTCLAYKKDAETLRATESPNSCHQLQTPTSVDTPGISYVMTDLLYTRPDKDYTTIIIVVCCIVGVIVIIVIFVVYFKVCRKPQPEPSAKVRKLKRKPSVTEYTPRSLGRAASIESVDESVVHKQSTGEILTGVLADKKQKHVFLNGDAYEPPKKEAWQKKWEAERNKLSPRLTKESLRGMKQSFSSDGEISRLDELSVPELDKAYTLSTSLPESLDLSVKLSPRNTSVPSKDVEPSSTNHKRYSERSHASASIPASTGKFGGSLQISSVESIQHPVAEQKLDTISENPLSRENTSAILQKKSSSKPLLEYPNLNRIMNSDVASLSTVVASQSTASVGDIRFKNSFQNISSRNSHLSASNASIFDDPAWLMENKITHRERDFESIKNLVSSIPVAKERDTKWFMKTQNKTENSRADIDYFKNRNKSIVGLNSSLRRSSSHSLEIIAREKMRRIHKKNMKANPKLIKPVSPHFDE